jgi:cyclopropane fatty-acyl-phospholipid synthase-like methyltransferase
MKKWHDIFPHSGKGKQMIQIVDWIQRHNLQTKSLLDFGCGKGGTMRWLQSLYPKIAVTGWDIGTELYRRRPRRTEFDGVYSIDCFEHIELEDIPDAIENLRRISNPDTEWCHIIDMTPAIKRLPDGRNAHVTLLTAPEWQDQFQQMGCQVTEVSVFRQPDPNYTHRVRCQIHCRPWWNQPARGRGRPPSER